MKIRVKPTEFQNAELVDVGAFTGNQVPRQPEIQARYPDWDQPEWIGFGIRSFYARRDS
jgi:hypothetical protein